MPEPVVVQVMRQFKADLLAREAGQMQEMARRWLVVEATLEGQLQALAADLAAEKAAGRSVSQTKLWRMRRYQTLLAQLKRELTGYQDYAERTIAAEQLAFAELGAQHAAAAIAASSPRVAASFDRLPVGAVQTMVGMAQGEAPLGKLLAASYPDSVEGLTNALIRGTALGWHPTKTAAAMRQGTAMGLNRSLVIARDQQLRAYRYASDAQYEASGVVTGKVRLAAHDGRTCMACLAKEGEVLPLDRPAYDHASGRCTFVPRVVGVPAPTWETGQAWFNDLPAAEQRSAMGDKRYEAYRSGKFDFADLAKTTHDDTWGDGLRVANLSELVRAQAA